MTRRPPITPSYRLREVGVGDLEEPYGLTLDQAKAKLIFGCAFYRAELGDHVDAERGSVITVKPGAVLDIAVNGKHYIAEGNGSLREITDQRIEDAAEFRAPD